MTLELRTARDERPVECSVHTLPFPEHPLAVPCTVYPPGGTDGREAGLVVHLHGSGGSHLVYNLMRPAYDELRRGLQEAGYWVVVPELGPSHWMNAHAAATLDAVITEMIAGKGIDPGRVHLFGTSMGGGSSLIYARTRPDVLCSVSAVFPMTDLELWVRESPAYLAPILQAHAMSSSNPSPALRALSPLHNASDFREIPMYILHGDADEIVPVHHGRDFAEALRREGGHVVYEEAPGFGHSDDISVGRHDEILRFIRTAEERRRSN